MRGLHAETLKRARRSNRIYVVACALLVCAATLLINQSMPTLEGIFPMITFFVCAGAGWMLYRVLQRAHVSLGQQTYRTRWICRCLRAFTKRGGTCATKAPLPP